MLIVKDTPRASHPHLPQRLMVRIQTRPIGPENKHERRHLAYSAAAALELNYYRAEVHNYNHHTTLAVVIDARGPDHAYQALTDAWSTHLRNISDSNPIEDPIP